MGELGVEFIDFQSCAMSLCLTLQSLLFVAARTMSRAERTWWAVGEVISRSHWVGAVDLFTAGRAGDHDATVFLQAMCDLRVSRRRLVLDDVLEDFDEWFQAGRHNDTRK